MLFQNDGLQFTHASTSAFLTQFYAILIPVWVAIRSRRNPGALVWTCCALVLAGVAILGQFDWHTLRLGRGEIETLISSLFFMGQILWLDRREFAGNRALPVTGIMFGVQALATGTLAVLLAPRDVDLVPLWTNGAWIGQTLLLTVMCTLAAFSLMNKWQPYITSTEAGLLYCSEPVFTSIMALFLPGWFSGWTGFNYPNEVASVNLLVGGGLITLANVLVQLQQVRRKIEPA